MAFGSQLSVLGARAGRGHARGWGLAHVRELQDRSLGSVLFWNRVSGLRTIRKVEALSGASSLRGCAGAAAKMRR